MTTSLDIGGFPKEVTTLLDRWRSRDGSRQGRTAWASD